jgi:hypothetical protein
MRKIFYIKYKICTIIENIFKKESCKETRPLFIAKLKYLIFERNDAFIVYYDTLSFILKHHDSFIYSNTK